MSDFKPRTKLPFIRKYELSPQGDPNEALRNVIRDIRAAHDLDIPFSVTTEKYKEFRFGGNVNKANIVKYVVIIGRAEDQGDE